MYFFNRNYEIRRKTMSKKKKKIFSWVNCSTKTTDFLSKSCYVLAPKSNVSNVKHRSNRLLFKSVAGKKPIKADCFPMNFINISVSILMQLSRLNKTNDYIATRPLSIMCNWNNKKKENILSILFLIRCFEHPIFHQIWYVYPVWKDFEKNRFRAAV